MCNYLFKFLSLFLFITSLTFQLTVADENFRKTTGLNYLVKEKSSSKFTSWGIAPLSKASINIRPAWKLFTRNKKNITVAVIDTGIDPAHPFLIKNLYVPGSSTTTNNFGVDFSKNRMSKTKPVDTHGHGTHVSGIIRSVYPDVKILALKYYNAKASGQDNLDSTIEALRYAVNSGVSVINYSGGGPQPSLEELRILKLAIKKDILIIAAAGNEESNIDNKKNAYYPASYNLENIVTVTAHDYRAQMLPSSNFGRKTVDISAPGKRIRSSYPGGKSGFLTGTSQATAFVTGVATLIRSQYPTLTAKQVKSVIIKSAKKELALQGKCSSGGRLDAENALKLAGIFSNKIKNKSSKRGLATDKKKKPGKIYYRIKKK